ncbi:MAG: PAS domain-containing protein, partial [Halanaerobiales bacterium]|nr:PAS domain-containing protein [Halanaerobiales bacterium]
NSINDMLFIHKIDFKKREFYPFLEVNEKAIEKTGYKKEKLLKMKLTDLVFDVKELTFFNYYFNKLIKENEVTLKSEIIKNNKETIYVEINSKIIEIDQNQFVLSILKESKDKNIQI